MKSKLKRFLVGFFIYYITGFILLNGLFILRHIGSDVDVLALSKAVFLRNFSSFEFWKTVITWPIFLGQFLFHYYQCLTGNCLD